MSKHQSPIEKQLEALPPLPLTVTKVIEVTANPESSANDLVKAILPDQTMCVTILKFANSVLYGRPKKVSSLETAVMVLGFNEIQGIVMGKAAVASFNKLFEEHRSMLDQFWTHAFNCGLAARIVSENMSLKSGQFFMAGLLHDIGKLAMALSFKDKYMDEDWLLSFSTSKIQAREKELFSISHDEIGARLLERWKFPNNLVSALRYHHAPGEAESMPGYPLVIQVADFLSHMLNLKETPDERRLKSALHHYLPEFESRWQQENLPWEDITLESWFAWLKVDAEHGSEILDVLAT
ncbi:MAG: HDOD domain-containing protein [Desulfobulbaceae bacterium]|nr:MAG: HDOD domain-containing protein [Desulfobulbaceae bacterium]